MIKTIPFQSGNLLSYADEGDPNGPPILVQHGLIASIRTRGLFEHLTDAGARLIRIARPGYGETSPYQMVNIGEWGEIVSGLVAALELKQFDVLGISSGAPYSYALGWKFPRQVRRLFILSGTPALYDPNVAAYWPYPLNQQASIAEMQKLARKLFFSNLSATDRQQADIQDSMGHDCFGVAQDLKLRCVDWGFELVDVRASVIMRHSRADSSVPLITAQMTAQLLPDCRLEIRDHDPHFSQAVLEDFISTVVQRDYN
jgi:pimeloyl-ACP methyl ester carboxylesterase